MYDSKEKVHDKVVRPFLSWVASLLYSPLPYFVNYQVSILLQDFLRQPKKPCCTSGLSCGFQAEDQGFKPRLATPSFSKFMCEIRINIYQEFHGEGKHHEKRTTVQALSS